MTIIHFKYKHGINSPPPQVGEVPVRVFSYPMMFPGASNFNDPNKINNNHNRKKNRRVTPATRQDQEA